MTDRTTEKKEKKGLTGLNVAVMYIGAIMGAGFASGRETWQFFGVFGIMGRVGVVIFAVLFLIVGFMVSYNAEKLGTGDMGAVIVPGKNKRLKDLVGYVMAATLAVVMMAMSAAAGALLHQQLGIDYWIGGALLAILATLTVLGDFDRVSRVFKYIMPVLCTLMIAVCITVIVVLPSGEHPAEGEASPVAPNWAVSAVLYTSYNVMAMIAVVASATINAKDRKAVLTGDLMGGVFLGILAMLILITVQIDGGLSQRLDMPVLGYASDVSDYLGILYTIVLFCAIYSTATGNFYGFTTKLKDGRHKKKIIIAAGTASFFLGLVGFKNVIKFISPVMGYAGIIMIIMMAVNCITLRRKEKMKIKQEIFPDNLVRVTGGPGGEAVLIKGKEKSVLHDCGMACFAEELISNIESELGDRSLDYVILSHSHYDHIGALPYIIDRWPGVKVCGAEKASAVFKSEGALNTICSLGRSAAKLYGKDPQAAKADGLRIDITLRNGDVIDIGGETIMAIETKGHTDCSMSYLLRESGILFTSESTGVVSKEGILRTSILKSFEDSIESADILRLMPYRCLLVPHFGIVERDLNSKFFDMYEEEAEKEKNLIESFIEKGYDCDRIFEEHKKVYWSEERGKQQPYSAYEMNTKIIINRIIKEHKNKL